MDFNVFWFRNGSSSLFPIQSAIKIFAWCLQADLFLSSNKAFALPRALIQPRIHSSRPGYSCASTSLNYADTVVIDDRHWTHHRSFNFFFSSGPNHWQDILICMLLVFYVIMHNRGFLLITGRCAYSSSCFPCSFYRFSSSWPCKKNAIWDPSS